MAISVLYSHPDDAGEKTNHPDSQRHVWEKPVLLSLDITLTELKNKPDSDGESPYHHS